MTALLPTLEEFFVAHGCAVRAPRRVLPFHRRIFRALTRWVTASLPDGRRNLAICMPPRHGKTFIYSQTLYSRRNADATPVLLIMQRLHERDLVGYLLEREPELWEVLQIPARDDEGRMLWPETFSAETAERMAALDPFAFSAQYMQRPTPAGGAMFRREMLRRYVTPPRIVRAGIFADTALKEGQRNDFSVLLYAGTDGRDLYVLDMDRGKWTAPCCWSAPAPSGSGTSRTASPIRRSSRACTSRTRPAARDSSRPCGRRRPFPSSPCSATGTR